MMIISILEKRKTTFYNEKTTFYNEKTTFVCNIGFY